MGAILGTTKIIKYIVLILCVILVTSCSKEETKPNVIFIMADDLGYGDLGVNGQTKINTPQLDKMAMEGVNFTNHYSGSPVCAPSRSVLLTGLHSGHTFIRGNSEVSPEGQLALPELTVTVAEVMKEAGYVTGGVGKWGLGGPGSVGHPNNQGFDYWYGHLCQRKSHSYYPDYVWRNNEKVVFGTNDPAAQRGEYVHDYFTKEALGFINKNKENPFFLYLAYSIPHLEFVAPEESMIEYRGKFPETPFAGTGYHEELPASPDIPFPGNYGPQEYPRAAYAAMITRMDRDIGKILDTIKELGLDENTLVIFTSDNGAAQGNSADAEFFNSNRGWRGQKGDVYEGGIHVPLIARWPGKIGSGRVSNHISAFWDFLPTMAELGGVELKTPTDGISYLSALLDKRNQRQHSSLYWEFKQKGIPMQAVRIGKYKGVKKGDKAIEIYDLNNDPKEMNDLAGDLPEVVSRVQTLFETERVPSEEFTLFN